ncbi:hypothetical protein BKA63DRAFT_229238 [Paraphoma chrysanthemicola]|nr:hypothetical protein BKA63DRAFT_229238 [Paraphoma chrysanthemicola]
MEHNNGDSHTAILPTYDACLSTRKKCIFCICLSALFGIICLGACGPILSGSAITASRTVYDAPFGGIYVAELHPVGAHIIPLLVNIVITGCTEVLGYLHATSLRWTLIQEGNLQFNSNLRLFTTSKHTWTNGKTINIASGALLVTCYTASGQMFPVQGSDRVIFINGISLLMLGIGLLGLCAIAILSISASKAAVLTWSPSPLTNALACLNNGTLVRRPGRGMMPVNMASLPAQPTVASPSQGPAREVYKQMDVIVKYVWLALVLNCFLAGIISAITYSGGATTVNFFNNDPADDGSTNMPIGDLYWPGPLLLFCGFLFGAVVQVFLTLTLHCMELLVSVARDEAIWRHASSNDGAALSTSALVGATQSWQWWVLFCLKPLAHWLFSSVGISYMVSEWKPVMSFNPVPLSVLAGVTFMLVVLGEFLVNTRQHGPQPAAYGHLQTLADLIDDWGAGSKGQLFWGVKSPVAGGLAKVGTSSRSNLVSAAEIGRIYS